MIQERLQILLDAAARLFIRQGYAKTQIAHIAKASGISVGTIYNVFVGKKELMHCVLKATIDPQFISGDIPVPVSDEYFKNLDKEIISAFEHTMIGFSEPLKKNDTDYRFGELISDTFDMLWKYAAGCLFIERNPTDCGQLFNLYKNYRKTFFSRMSDYFSWFITRGDIRPVPDPELAVIFIIETLTWWAMDMRYASFETADISRERAKAVCMDTLTAAYKNSDSMQRNQHTREDHNEH